MKQTIFPVEKNGQAIVIDQSGQIFTTKMSKSRGLHIDWVILNILWRLASSVFSFWYEGQKELFTRFAWLCDEASAAKYNAENYRSWKSCRGNNYSSKIVSFKIGWLVDKLRWSLYLK